MSASLPPTLDALIEAFPSLHRPRYTQGLALASSSAPALRACGFAVIGSLLREGIACRSDAAITAARLAETLGVPDAGRRVLDLVHPLAAVHRTAVDEVRAALVRVAPRLLESWFAPLVPIARSALLSLETLPEPWLGLGPTASLVTLYAAQEWRYSLGVLHPRDFKERYSICPPTCIVLEPDLDHHAIVQLFTAYTDLGVANFLFASKSEAAGDIRGYRKTSELVRVPAGVPLFLGDDLYAKAVQFDIENSGTGEASVWLHTWQRTT